MSVSISCDLRHYYSLHNYVYPSNNCEAIFIIIGTCNPKHNNIASIWHPSQHYTDSKTGSYTVSELPAVQSKDIYGCTSDQSTSSPAYGLRFATETSCNTPDYIGMLLLY